MLKSTRHWCLKGIYYILLKMCVFVKMWSFIVKLLLCQSLHRGDKEKTLEKVYLLCSSLSHRSEYLHASNP